MSNNHAVPGGFPLRWLLLSFRGRISPRIYWPALIAAFSLNFALTFQFVGMTEEDLQGSRPLLLLLGALAVLYFHGAIAVKRLHDVGYGGLLALAVVVPLINLVFALWVGFLPGDDGPNAYGDAPDTPPPP